MISKQIDSYMKEALKEAVSILFPIEVDSVDVIARHNWRTRSVLGTVDGKVVYWRGWKASLKTIEQSYRTLYIDFVPNILPLDEQKRLLGEEFASKIDGMDFFVVMFAANFKNDMRQQIAESGFVVREIGYKLHACEIANPEDFLSQPVLFWGAYLARLANLQRFTRKPRNDVQSNDPIEKQKNDIPGDLDWEDEYGLLDI